MPPAVGGVVTLSRDGAPIHATLDDLHLVHPKAPGPRSSRPSSCRGCLPAGQIDADDLPGGGGVDCMQPANALLRAALPGGEPVAPGDRESGVVERAGRRYAVAVDFVWRMADCGGDDPPDFPDADPQRLGFAIAAQPG